MYRQYRDVPRIDQPVAMMAQLHLREMQCKAAQMRLARQARPEATGARRWLPSLVLRARQVLAGLGRHTARVRVRIVVAERAAHAPDA